MVFTYDKSYWILISQSVHNKQVKNGGKTRGQKKAILIRNSKCAGELKLGQWQKQLHCHLHPFSSQNYRHQAQI